MFLQFVNEQEQRCYGDSGTPAHRQAHDAGKGLGETGRIASGRVQSRPHALCSSDNWYEIHSCRRKIFSDPQITKLFLLYVKGVPKEVLSGEQRVALSPAGAKQLLGEGIKAVKIESGAGVKAGWSVSLLSSLAHSCSGKLAHVTLFPPGASAGC